MTHVCFIGSDLCPPWNEGRKVVSRNIIHSLKENTDLEISVISDSGKDTDRIEGINYVESTKLTTRLKGYDPLLYLDVVRAIHSVNKKNKIDVLHLLYTNFYTSSLYGKLNRMKIVGQYFGNPHFNLFAKYRAPKFVDTYLSTSMERYWFNDLGINNHQCLNPPIDTSVYKKRDKSEARRYFDLPEDKFILLYIGNLGAARFSSDFLKSSSFLKKSDNLMVVYGNYVDGYWENNSLLADSNIIFRKQVLNEHQKSMLYSAADAFILPFAKSAADYKRVFVIDPPLTMLEAMACETPVIVPDIFSIPYIIKDSSNGYLTKLGDFSSVDNILVDISEKKNLYIGQNARSTILDGFSFTETASKLTGIYRDVLHE